MIEYDLTVGQLMSFTRTVTSPLLQRDIADALGMNGALLSFYMTDHRPASEGVLRRFASVCGLSQDQLTQLLCAADIMPHQHEIVTALNRVKPLLDSLAWPAYVADYRTSLYLWNAPFERVFAHTPHAPTLPFRTNQVTSQVNSAVNSALNAPLPSAANLGSAGRSETDGSEGSDERAPVEARTDLARGPSSLVLVPGLSWLATVFDRDSPLRQRWERAEGWEGVALAVLAHVARLTQRYKKQAVSAWSDPPWLTSLLSDMAARSPDVFPTLWDTSKETLIQRTHAPGLPSLLGSFAAIALSQETFFTAFPVRDEARLLIYLQIPTGLGSGSL